MSYTTTNQLTITVENEKYRAEFDGKEVCVFDKDQGAHISFMGTMAEGLDLASILYEIDKQSGKTKVIVEDQL